MHVAEERTPFIDLQEGWRATGGREAFHHLHQRAFCELAPVPGPTRIIIDGVNNNYINPSSS
jgi:hypothetical protein